MRPSRTVIHVPAHDVRVQRLVKLGQQPVVRLVVQTAARERVLDAFDAGWSTRHLAMLVGVEVDAPHERGDERREPWRRRGLAAHAPAMTSGICLPSSESASSRSEMERTVDGSQRRSQQIAQMMKRLPSPSHT
jgi:hypothetical protein